MREIYTNPIAQFEETFAKKLVAHFDGVLDDQEQPAGDCMTQKMTHKSAKRP